MSKFMTTKTVGRKFHEDGSVRRFPGNTIICMVDPQSHTYSVLCEVAEMFKEFGCARKFTPLPPSSYHMTVIQGICDEERKPELWSRKIPLDMPLEDVDRFFAEQYRHVPVPDGFTMKFDHLNTGIALTVRLEPASDGDAEALRLFRERVSEALGIRFPDHDRYKFHISLAYQIYELTPEEAEELQRFKRQADDYLRERFGLFASSQPRLTYFKDMFGFFESRPADE